jgi:ribose 5-phosphate isomerase B
VGEGLAKEMVQVYLGTEFEGGRHTRRLGKIAAIEEEKKGVFKRASFR